MRSVRMRRPRPMRYLRGRHRLGARRGPGDAGRGTSGASDASTSSGAVRGDVARFTCAHATSARGTPQGDSCGGTTAIACRADARDNRASCCCGRNATGPGHICAPSVAGRSTPGPTCACDTGAPSRAGRDAAGAHWAEHPSPAEVTRGRAAQVQYALMGQPPARTMTVTSPHATPPHHVAPGGAPLEQATQVPPAKPAGIAHTPEVLEVPALGAVPVGLQPTKVMGEPARS